MDEIVRIHRHDLERVLNILANESLSCPPPYDFTHEDYCMECPQKLYENAGINFDCRKCWEKYLILK